MRVVGGCDAGQLLAARKWLFSAGLRSVQLSLQDERRVALHKYCHICLADVLV